MFFPIGDEQVKGGHKPFVAYLLIGINILVFLFQVTMPPGLQQGFVVEYGVIPKEIISGQDYFTLITNMFLHGGWMHLIGNMLFLWVFADNIEAVIGKIPFTLFYIGGGLAASAAHILFNLNSTLPAVGASGAISAVLGAYIVMFPSSKVRVFILIFFRSVYMPAFYFLGIWGVQQFINGFISIVPSSAYTSGVAWWAHIGGFVFGIAAGFLIRRRYESRYEYDMNVPSPKDLV
jgi:membrane associated rhomboid family serine protease